MKSSILSELLVATLTAVVTACCGVDIPAAPAEVPLSEEVRDGDSTSYGEGAGYEIRDVRSRNIRFHGVPSFYLPPYFHEPEPCPEGGLKDISFLNILYL